MSFICQVSCRTIAVGLFSLIASGGVKASPVDFSRYIAPDVDGILKLESQYLAEKNLSLFVDYEWAEDDFLVVTSYTAGGGLRTESKEYSLRFEESTIRRTENMSNISQSFAGVSATSTQTIPRYLVGGELVPNYGRYDENRGITTFVSDNGDTFEECITLNLKEIGSDNVLVSTYCKGVGLVSRYETTNDITALSINSFSPDEVSRLEERWAGLCPEALEDWAGTTFTSPELEVEVCDCVISKAREQVNALVEYSDSYNPLGNGSFANDFITATRECVN